MNRKFLKSVIKIFILSFLVVLVGTVLSENKPKINFDFLKTTEVEKDPTMENVKSNLKEKGNHFQLKKQSNLIQSAYADNTDANVSAFIVVDFDTGAVLAEKNSSKRLPIASITKVMTSIVALDLANPNDKFIASRVASNQIPTKLGISRGEKMTLSDLISASLLTSANDATQVIKEGVNRKYDREVFIRAMNLKAIYMGLSNTSFSNPQGFDGAYNFSTAEDVAVMARYGLTNYPLIRENAAKEYIYLPTTSEHKQYDLQNWNGLLGVYPGTIGLKIGNTEDAGRTTVAVSKRENKTLIVVVLGAKDIIERDMIAAGLLDYGFEKSAGLKKIAISEEDLRLKYSKWKYW